MQKKESQTQLILDAIKNEKLMSLRIRSENLYNLKTVERVVFLGSSGTGKSTIETGVRQRIRLEDGIAIPYRVVTRSPRSDDKNICYLSDAAFAICAEAQMFGLYGKKHMENERRECYGFWHPPKGTLGVYFANNGVVKNPELVTPTAFLNNSLLIVIYTPDKERERRLRERSPELFSEKPSEAAFRLSAAERAAGTLAHAHLIVKNFRSYQSRVIDDTTVLLQSLGKYHTQLRSTEY